jgi:hypothetical protein
MLALNAVVLWRQLQRQHADEPWLQSRAWLDGTVLLKDALKAMMISPIVSALRCKTGVVSVRVLGAV